MNHSTISGDKLIKHALTYFQMDINSFDKHFEDLFNEEEYLSQQLQRKPRTRPQIAKFTSLYFIPGAVLQQYEVILDGDYERRDKREGFKLHDELACRLCRTHRVFHSRFGLGQHVFDKHRHKNIIDYIDLLEEEEETDLGQEESYIDVVDVFEESFENNPEEPEIIELLDDSTEENFASIESLLRGSSDEEDDGVFEVSESVMEIEASSPSKGFKRNLLTEFSDDEDCLENIKKQRYEDESDIVIVDSFTIEDGSF